MTDPTGAPDASGPAEGELIERLRAGGCEPDARSLADALWLAQWTPTATTAHVTPGSPADEASRDAGPPIPGPAVPGAPAASPSAVPGAGPHHGSPLLTPTPVAPPRHVPPRSIPALESLPGLRELQRALSPLRRHRATTGRPAGWTLDERVTAERSAGTGLTVPVLHPVMTRTASLQILVDSSSSMVVWERAVEELTQVLERVGAFRDVRRHHLHPAPDGGEILISTGRGAHERPRSARGSLDPTGGTFTLLISDCAGPLWRTGAAQRFLYRLAAQRAPVAVLQPLPQRLWSRTALLPRPGTLRLRGPSGLECGFTPDDPSDEPYGALPVPVLPPSPHALSRWAGLLTGLAPTRIKGAAAWVRPGHPEVPSSNGAWRTADERVSRFRADASPTAQRLAAYLAAAPLLLPVMLLVQRTMLKDESGPAELAEVLLGGLLSHANPAGTRGETWYDFAPGVRDLLLSRLTRDEAQLVLKKCSEYVAERFDDPRIRNFPALALAQLGGAADQSVVQLYSSGAAGPPAPFAAVSAKVVRRYLPDPDAPPPSPGQQVARARESLAVYERERDGRKLLEAVRILRDYRASGWDDGPAEAGALLAQALLSLHRTERNPAVLDEARSSVGECLARQPESGPPGPWHGRALLTLGRVLRAQADHRRAEGDADGAWACLRSADRELNRAVSRLAPNTGDGLAVVLERADVLHELWQLRGDLALLHQAVGNLRGIAGAQSFWAPHTADLRLRLGHLLLTVATATDDPEWARTYAAEAVEELTAAREVLAAETDGPSRMTGLLLDLAEARERGGEDAEAVLRTLEEAERAAEFAPGQRVSVVLRIARTHLARSTPDAPRHACEAFGRAAGLLPDWDPGRAAVLEEWGRTLLELADPEAVFVLTDCARATAADSPALVRRLVLLGRALRGTDPDEAVRVLSRAAEAGEPPGDVACAWYELGLVKRELVWRDRDFTLLHEAAAHWRRAAEVARRAGDEALAGLAEVAYRELEAQLRPPERESG
ncbi:SAV_2336 N-terminal domain-related protein [Streptomyces sp. NBC_01518]|uniref:SAV_2336 N-terminal domain-related protein n=1 Tax=Streptomyces sp. NBC_01518 TaxID=2903891 RepID=UPI0038703E5D